jgi:hypothetical protein
MLESDLDVWLAVFGLLVGGGSRCLVLTVVHTLCEAL